MGAPRSTHSAATPPPGWISIFLLALIVGVFLVRALAVWQHTPVTHQDEVVILEPAIHWVQHGKYANPGLAEQIPVATPRHTLRNATGMNWPAYLWLQTAAAAVFGSDMWVRRSVDLALLAVAAVLLHRLAARISRVPLIATATTACFLLSFPVWFAVPGRPDVLGCSLGLGACLLVTRPASGGSRIAWNAVLTGLVLGFCAITHHTAAAIWVLTALVLATWTHGADHTVRSMAVVAVSALTAILTWPLSHASDLAFLRAAFGAMASIKSNLTHNFPAGLMGHADLLILRNPIVPATFLTSLPRLLTLPQGHRNLMLALFGVLAAAVLALSAWIEPANRGGHVSVWALACIIAALAASAIHRSARPARRSPTLALGCALWFAWVFLDQGGLLARHMLRPELREKHRLTRETLARHVGTNDAVLADSALFFDVPSLRRTAMWWHDRLSLTQFHWVASTLPEPVVVEHTDQLNNAITPGQATELREHFQLVERVPPFIWTGRRNRPDDFVMSSGLYLFRNTRADGQAPATDRP
jgi:hypothetical protein